MYITRKKSVIGILEKPRIMSSRGLGADVPSLLVSLPGVNQIPMVSSILGKPKQQEGWGTISKAGQTVQSAIQKLDMIMPFFGFKFIGKLLDVLGVFKKATHMESCMKWWSDSNIASMMGGIVAYPIDVTQQFSNASREYQLEYADSITNLKSVQNLLDSSRRKSIMVRMFTSIVRANPDIMKAQCASMPQGRAETGFQMSSESIAVIWGQIKELARQQEYRETIKEIENVLASYNVRVEQKVAAVQTSRQAGLVTGQGAFQLPVGVKSIDRGALVLTPGTSSNMVIDYDAGKQSAKQVVVVAKPKTQIQEQYRYNRAE